jgi:hypothetical protein
VEFLFVKTDKEEIQERMDVFEILTAWVGRRE